jgi:hypothetical protein
MTSPLDWDYAAIATRQRELFKPPFTTSSGTPENHCLHCQKPENEQCGASCQTVYKEVYGFDPPKDIT